MRQRVMIAKALACHPAVMIADEPTVALDVTIQAQIIYQDPYSALNPRQKVGDILGEPFAIHHQGIPKEREERGQWLMEVVGLRPGQARRYPHEFSGGQRQRIVIARALALQPKLILADEPVSALDVSIQAQVINLLQDLRAQFGLTYICISNDLSVVEHICDRVAVMYIGRLLAICVPRSIDLNREKASLLFSFTLLAQQHGV